MELHPNIERQCFMDDYKRYKLEEEIINLEINMEKAEC